ncbi:DEAD/DEAH box helicase [Jatrophihabitans sp.]|uniref:DEAD/DEAH box helicase n=1 Tax=Jatrophihabitans sp. TaxID=1932789 RepID=UPI0030C684BE|nr:Helicase-like protein [Jatrophihabitans sp.]
MSPLVHAEIHADGQRIVIIASGPVEDVAFMAKQLQALTPLFKPSEPKGALLCQLTWAAVVQLSATYGPAFVPGPRLQEWILDQASRRTTPPTGQLTVPIPDGFVPRPYQVDGALMMASTGRALIFDEPRTGKTITTILGLGELAGEGQLGGLPIIVVCPASVVDPWVQAFRDWAPYWKTVAWRGIPKRRHGLFGHADVYVTSYDTARADAKDTNPRNSPLVALDARSLVVDECHRIKNPSAKQSLAVRRLARNVKQFAALSGTPITHHPADLWPALVCLAPGAWPSRERWVPRYCSVVPTVDYGESILGLNPHSEAEFRLTILGQHRRVARADVMDQLPPKVYSVRTVELPAAYRKAYDDFEKNMLAELPDGQELSVMDVLSQMTLLSQLSCAAADVEVTIEHVDDGLGGVIEKRHVHVELKNPSWKVDALLEVLAERPGEQTVAFAVSAQLARLAGEAAAQAGLRVGYVIGGQTAKNRTETIAAFQAGQLDLICATTAAGGVGITLSAAGTLVFLQRPWSLVDSLQAEDRAEGDMKQTRGTEIVDIVAADTLDTRVRAVLRERAGQLSDLVQDPRIAAELLGGASVTPIKKAS